MNEAPHPYPGKYPARTCVPRAQCDTVHLVGRIGRPDEGKYMDPFYESITHAIDTHTSARHGIDYTYGISGADGGGITYVITVGMHTELAYRIFAGTEIYAACDALRAAKGETWVVCAGPDTTTVFLTRIDATD